ncbi:MAG TPA: hypothetical protein VHU19_07230 [Pyrinomonadaceae bacterium]|nr:hypothetical protein [Pyrinomonadaceae bacterium]
MNLQRRGLLTKLKWSLPWLMRYPLWRAREAAGRLNAGDEPRHLIFIVANHFEPGWNDEGLTLDWSTQLSRLDHWCEKARRIGEAVRDHDGTPFRHTNFYPAEQYHSRILERMAELQAEGFGEVEVHLHHGVEKPDDAVSLRRALVEFRDVLAEEHKCLSRWEGEGSPMYAFVHGNWALANSAGGRYCGVDSEMQILAETGCYADFTLPSAPDESQVARINAVYQCGHPLDERKPHRSGPGLRAGVRPRLPVLFTGPLVFNWGRRIRGLPVPRVDDGVLASNYTLDLARLDRWRGARVHVKGRPEWVFIKLYCHGFFPFDEEAMIGETLRRFLEETIEYGDRSGEFKVHFASAREAFNIAMAAVEGRDAEPGLYRDYRLRTIMSEGADKRTNSQDRRHDAPAVVGS